MQAMKMNLADFLAGLSALPASGKGGLGKLASTPKSQAAPRSDGDPQEIVIRAKTVSPDGSSEKKTFVLKADHDLPEDLQQRLDQFLAQARKDGVSVTVEPQKGPTKPADKDPSTQTNDFLNLLIQQMMAQPAPAPEAVNAAVSSETQAPASGPDAITMTASADSTGAITIQLVSSAVDVSGQAPADGSVPTRMAELMDETSGQAGAAAAALPVATANAQTVQTQSDVVAAQVAANLATGTTPSGGTANSAASTAQAMASASAAAAPATQNQDPDRPAALPIAAAFDVTHSSNAVAIPAVRMAGQSQSDPQSQGAQKLVPTQSVAIAPGSAGPEGGPADPDRPQNTAATSTASTSVLGTQTGMPMEVVGVVAKLKTVAQGLGLEAVPKAARPAAEIVADATAALKANVATGATGVSPTATANPASVSEQIAQALPAQWAQNATDQITIHLDPPDLGKLHLNFRSDGNEIVGQIRVESLATLAQVHREMPSVMDRLAESGISLRRLDVVLDQQAGTGNSSLQDGRGWQQSFGRDAYPSGEGGDAAPVETASADAGQDRRAGWLNETSINVWM